jgi:NADPH-dependent 2,4-dienoyl-CoA reductase/sulfur reductase-like enzyme
MSAATDVLVVGAGPAGLEAARTAALRGHNVVVHERADQPGGLLEIQRAAPFRNEIANITDWLWRELQRLDAGLFLESPVDADVVKRINPDAVILATGSLPRRDGVQRMRPAHRVPGIHLPHVVTPLEVLTGGVEIPRRAVVFDDLGNYQAVGSAEWLLDRGAEVLYATSFAEFCPDLFRSFQRDATAARLQGYPGFSLETRSSVESISPDRAVLRGIDGGRETTVEADLVVLVTGFDPQTDLFEQLRATGVDARVTGDAIAPLLLPHAIASGRAAGAAV